jgi:hypothetical protein
MLPPGLASIEIVAELEDGEFESLEFGVFEFRVPKAK